MQTTDTAALLQAAPEEHSRRCALAKSAIDSKRWPAAACGLRHAAVQAQEWATQARALADLCDAEAESGRAHSAVPATLAEPAQALLSPAGPITLEALEAGLMALAHRLGRDHAVHVRRAINGVLQTMHDESGSRRLVPAALLAEVQQVGAMHDSASLEPADAA
ncbi:hypothetical protein [Acidovorax temperans]|nr:hypothetical protein [Acidovorax temperans]